MIKITLRNYRGFTSDSPAVFTIGDGFTSFVGKNNAGKSTCLRAIFELRNLFNSHNLWIGVDPNSLLIQCATEPDPSALLNFDNTNPAFITLEIEPLDDVDTLQIIQSTVKIDRDNKATLHSLKLNNTQEVKEITAPFDNQSFITGPLHQKHARIRELKSQQIFDYEYSQLINAIQLLSRSAYYGAYRNAINEGAAQYYDIAVGTQLIAQWDQWKAGSNLASKRAIAKVQSDVARLLGYDSVEINASSDNKTLDVTVNSHPFKLSDLGAGVAELIIALSNALVRKPSYILIDEPEGHLHPSLQIDFLTTLATYATHGIAFSTHSIGLARTIADRTYVVSRNKNVSNCTLYEKHTRLGDMLGNLSYSGYIPSENYYVLLVEGTTEVKTFQMLLKKLNKDHMYAILSLGGSSLIRENSDAELNEVVRVAGAADRVFAIIDSERKESDAELDRQHQAFKLTCQNLGIKLLITERRATENYFSDIAIKNCLGDKFSALTEFEDHDKKWPKSENWKLADKESDNFFKEHDLGKFLIELP